MGEVENETKPRRAVPRWLFALAVVCGASMGASIWKDWPTLDWVARGGMWLSAGAFVFYWSSLFRALTTPGLFRFIATGEGPHRQVHICLSCRRPLDGPKHAVCPDCGAGPEQPCDPVRHAVASDTPIVPYTGTPVWK